MSGKGDTPRPVDRDKWGRGWDRIFGADGKSTDWDCVAGEGQDGGSTPPCSTLNGKHMNKIGWYTFPRSGRTWMMRMMLAHGVKCRAVEPQSDDIWLYDHGGSVDKYPDRIGVTVLRDPVRSMYSWYWLDSVNGEDTIEHLDDRLEHYIAFWKEWAVANVLSGNCHVLRFEDLCENTEGVVEWVCDLIGCRFMPDKVVPARPVKSREEFKYHSDDLVDSIICRLQPEWDAVYTPGNIRTVKI